MRQDEDPGDTDLPLGDERIRELLARCPGTFSFLVMRGCMFFSSSQCFTCAQERHTRQSVQHAFVSCFERTEDYNRGRENGEQDTYRFHKNTRLDLGRICTTGLIPVLRTSQPTGDGLQL